MLKNCSRLIFLLVAVSISTSSTASPNFNTTAFGTCTTALAVCAQSLLDYNQNTTDFSSCAAPFGACLKDFVFTVAPPYPEACQLAQSAWENLYISIGAFVGILLLNQVVIPALLKFISWAITSCMKVDRDEHPYLHRIGQCLGIFTDADRDGKVMASELIYPQAIVAFTSLALPFYYWFLANDQEARCRYALDLYKYTNPELFIDDDDLWD